MFQFPPSHGGRLICAVYISISNLFQFPPSHGGRPRQETFLFCQVRVSIPALAWRATEIEKSMTVFPRFQFPPSHGGRLIFLLFRQISNRVSIPALAWRATLELKGLEVAVKRFNSRPRMEGDYSSQRQKIPKTTFQFPPSHGGRPLLQQRHVSVLQCFNSRPRMEGD